MKPWIHSQLSVKRWGGKEEDYLPMHNWLDSTKSTTANFYHRAILHNTFGVFLGEQLFGPVITNSDGKIVVVKDILEWHIQEDCRGKIPTIDDWLDGLPPKSWMIGGGQSEWVRKNVGVMD